MSSTQESHTSLKILIVDDDITVSDILRRIIVKLGCQVTCIHDGREVGNALIASEPDVIFLDLILPGIDGVEIISGLGQAGCKSKIVLMSGLDKRTLSSVSEGARKNNLEVIDAVTKPFAPGQVEAILQPLIDAKPSTQSSSNTDQPTFSFGPHVVYEPETPLGEESNSSNNWVRASLSWRMDDGQVVDIASLAGDSYSPRMVRGVLESILQGIQKNIEIFKNSERSTYVKIPLSLAILSDESAPDQLDQLIMQTGLGNHSIMFEIDEAIIISSTTTVSNVFSRLKIKGFKLSVCVREKIDEVLALLDKLPIDEVTLDMADNRFRDAQLDNAETEFQIASLVSYVTKADLAASVKNVLNAQQADFAKRCKFTRASGRFIQEPGSAQAAQDLFNRN